jgi:LysM repeat protein
MAGQRNSLEHLFITFLCIFSAIAVYSIHAGEAKQVPAVYIVKKGDTLWNISQRYLADPFLWPALWEMNKYIKDPQWIYPGQPLMLKEKNLVPSEHDNLVPSVHDNLVHSEHPGRAVKFYPPTQLPDAMQSEVPPPISEYLINRDLIDSCGYILPRKELLAKEQEEQWGSVIDGQEEKISYSCPDVIYINKGKNQVAPGALFTVFRTQDMVFHPETNREIGYPVQVVGIIEVEKVFDKIARAKITKSFSEIHLQDRIKAYQQDPLPIRSEPNAKIQGTLIASEDERINLATQNIVFLDQGTRQQVQAGNCFSIYRKNPISGASFEEDARFKEKDSPSLSLSPWPQIVNDVIGELLILNAQENTSTAVITKSADPIMVGCLFSSKP